MSNYPIPKNATHWPVVAINYEKKDEESGGGDAKWLSLGRSTWNKEDFSAKIFQNLLVFQKKALPLHPLNSKQQSAKPQTFGM